MPHQRVAPPDVPLALPYVPLQPTDLTCTCTTYAGVHSRCIYCTLMATFSNPFPTLSHPVNPFTRRRNFTIPNPLQGHLV